MNGPMRVRKRPLIVEAMRYDGSNASEVAEWVGPDAWLTTRSELVIRTPQGEHTTDPGDYVIRGVLGEHYQIPTAVYDATYDLVKDDR